MELNIFSANHLVTLIRTEECPVDHYQDVFLNTLCKNPKEEYSLSVDIGVNLTFQLC